MYAAVIAWSSKCLFLKDLTGITEIRKILNFYEILVHMTVTTTLTVRNTASEQNSLKD